MVCIVINWLYINVAIEEIDIKPITKTVEVERLVVKVVIIYQANGQVARIARVDNRLD